MTAHHFGVHGLAIAAIVVLGTGGILLGTGGGAARAEPEPVSITIATGRVGGLYHPVGGALCKRVNDNTDDHGITCTVEITEGSPTNVEELRAADVDLALVQSDWQYNAFKGIEQFTEAGPFSTLRSVFALYVEQVSFAARSDRKINSFDDLAGKRVYMGPPGSIGREAMLMLLEARDWAPQSVTDIFEYKAANPAQALCENEFDAGITVMGHPSPIFKEATATCDVTLLSVERAIIERIAKSRPYFVDTVIPADTYRGNHRDIPGLGVVATLVTTSEAKAEVIHTVTKAFFDNLGRLRDASSAFSTLTTTEMTRAGLTAPLHEGAATYFAEAGLN